MFNTIKMFFELLTVKTDKYIYVSYTCKKSFEKELVILRVLIIFLKGNDI